MLKAVFFDLDGTLLPLDEDQFVKVYFGKLSEKMANYGYNKEKLIDCIWAGTKLMYQNDGKKDNFEVFWEYFESIYGNEKLDDIKIFDEFYYNEFKETKKVCKDNPYARIIIDECKKLNLETYLTTNPIFPLHGTQTRMGFVDLKLDDFTLVTSYENSRFTKPNPEYFKEILELSGLNSDEVILFGNNTYEDGECSLACGIKCYLVGDYIINHPKSTHTFEHIKMEDVIPTIIKEMKLREN